MQFIYAACRDTLITELNGNGKRKNERMFNSTVVYTTQKIADRNSVSMNQGDNFNLMR